MAGFSVRPQRRGLVVCCCHQNSPFALQAPENDAVFYESFLQRSGFEVRTLSDRKLGMESSTRCNIIRGIQWLVADSRPGDNIVFVFLGHGTATVGTSYERRDCLDRALCTAATSESGAVPASTLPSISDAELQALFSPVPAGALLTCILDCPYGDTVLKLPWYYNAKTETFCHVPQAIQHSVWPGDKHRQSEGVHYLVRGVRPDTKVSRRSGSVVTGPRELFPGVVAFILCACRPDQVCFESTVVESQPQGVFSSCLAMTLLHRMRGPCTYSDLARCVQEQVQSYLKEHHLAARGLAQDILLGFNTDPNEVLFLQPPKESIVLQPSICSLSNSQPSEYASILAGESQRWPHVLMQLCRVGDNTLDANGPVESQSPDILNQSILACEVVGECWLPHLDHLIEEISIQYGRQNGDLECHVGFRGGTYRSQHAHSCELKEPSLGTRNYTFAANAPSHLLHASLFGQRTFPNRPDVACFNGALEWLNQRTLDSKETSSACRKTLVPAADIGVDKLREQISTKYDGNVKAFMRNADVHGHGELNATEFEWACHRRLEMDINVARCAFEECLRLGGREEEGTLLLSSLCLALQARESSTSQLSIAAKDPMQIHANLEWSFGNTDAASLQLQNLEICQTPPLPATDYLANGVACIKANNTRRGRPSANWTSAHHTNSKLHADESETRFFLRVCLCASQSIPSFMPHVVHVSTPLWRGVRPDSGELYLRLPPASDDATAVISICTVKRLCQLQQEAPPMSQVHAYRQSLQSDLPSCSRQLTRPELPEYIRPEVGCQETYVCGSAGLLRWKSESNLLA